MKINKFKEFVTILVKETNDSSIVDHLKSSGRKPWEIYDIDSEGSDIIVLDTDNKNKDRNDGERRIQDLYKEFKNTKGLKQFFNYLYSVAWTHHFLQRPGRQKFIPPFDGKMHNVEYDKSTDVYYLKLNPGTLSKSDIDILKKLKFICKNDNNIGFKLKYGIRPCGPSSSATSPASLPTTAYWG